MSSEDDDQGQHALLQGELADLEALRNVDSQSTALEQRGELLTTASGIPCKTTCTDTDDDEEEGGNSGFTDIPGQVFVTKSQVLFVSTSSTHSEHDLVIGACNIQLHALQDEPQLSLYLQLGDDDNVLEVTIAPAQETDGQVLFDALCKLVSLHPIPQDDDEDDNDGNDAFGSEDFIWAPASGTAFGDTVKEGGATEQQRAAMLGRLDNLLVENPQFQVQEGQFEDAEDYDNAEAQWRISRHAIQYMDYITIKNINNSSNNALEDVSIIWFVH